MVFVTKHRVQMVVTATLLSVGLVGCSSGFMATPATTVTVTAKPVPVPTKSQPSPITSTAQQDGPRDKKGRQGEGPHPAFGIMVENARQLCTTPLESLPELVNPGDSQEFTQVLQIVAVTFRYETGEFGEYDAKTIRAVKRMQSDLGVVPDGQVGPITWSALRDWHCPDYEPYFAEDYGSDASTNDSATPYEEPTSNPAPSPTRDLGPVPVSLPKIGTCPFGYISNFDTCDPGPNARYAIVKTGAMCPVGYQTDWQYCVLQ